MTVFRVDVSLVAAHHIGAHISPHLDKTSIRLSATYPMQRVFHIATATATGRSLWADEVTGTIFCTDDFKHRAEALGGTLGPDFGICTEI